MLIIKCAVITIAVLLLSGCASDTLTDPDTGRWYSEQQVQQGLALYSQNCATCHGVAGVGNPTWQTERTPPPLNGTAHTWHHSFDVLDRIIVEGGTAFGGSMPAFEGKLDADERRAIIGYLQSLWDDEVYGVWASTIDVQQ